MKHSIYILLLLILFSCKEQQARRPKQNTVNNFYKEVLIQNKKLNALEKERLIKFISKDTVHNFKSSSHGFWYAYITKDTVNSKTPKQNDIVAIEYDIKTIANTLVYNKQEITYKVDKQDFIPGLEEGVKLMKEGEEVIFIIPSYTAYGVTGDGNKIKMNQPIKSIVKLNQIKKEDHENN